MIIQSKKRFFNQHSIKMHVLIKKNIYTEFIGKIKGNVKNKEFFVSNLKNMN